MAVEGDKDESGLDCLVLLLRFHGVAVDPAQIGHRFGGGPIKVTEMLRCAKELKLKARAVVVDWPRLAKLSLPAIAECKDGGFLILGKVSDDKALVRLAAMLVRDTSTAEEVVQEAFIKMHDGWHRLKDSEKALAYLRQAVVNGSRSVLRHRTVVEKHAPKPELVE